MGFIAICSKNLLWIRVLESRTHHLLPVHQDKQFRLCTNDRKIAKILYNFHLSCFSQFSMCFLSQFFMCVLFASKTFFIKIKSNSNIRLLFPFTVHSLMHNVMCIMHTNVSLLCMASTFCA